VKISTMIEKIPGGKKGIKIIGIKFGIDLKRIHSIFRELHHINLVSLFLMLVV